MTVYQLPEWPPGLRRELAAVMETVGPEEWAAAAARITEAYALALEDAGRAFVELGDALAQATPSGIATQGQDQRMNAIVTPRMD